MVTHSSRETFKKEVYCDPNTFREFHVFCCAGRKGGSREEREGGTGSKKKRILTFISLIVGVSRAISAFALTCVTYIPA